MASYGSEAASQYAAVNAFGQGDSFVVHGGNADLLSLTAGLQAYDWRPRVEFVVAGNQSRLLSSSYQGFLSDAGTNCAICVRGRQSPFPFRGSLPMQRDIKRQTLAFAA